MLGLWNVEGIEEGGAMECTGSADGVEGKGVMQHLTRRCWGCGRH